jgi:ATP-dependent 26S proteasome regulatory subunit
LTLAGLDRLGLPGGALLAAPTARLITSGLLTVDSEGPWARRAVAASARLVWYLRGDDSPDPGLPPGALLEDLPESTEQSAPPATDESRGIRLWLVHGADRRSRQLAAAGLTGCRSLLVSPGPSEPGQWAALAREAVVRGVPVLLELDGGLSPAAADQLAAADMVRWVLSSREEIAVESLPMLGFHEHRVTDGRPTPTEWRQATGHPPDGAFRLDREQLRLAARVAPPGSGVTVTDRVRRVAAGHLDTLARRMSLSRGWDDLVLPADQQAQLRELVARHRFRGRVYDDWRFLARPSSGLVALFSGPSGTGKTLAAEVIAADLGLDAYKIDLSSVVSKYIGETEKNLGRIFDAAASADLVLFFDEADSLFGKRSEVSDARDRYANIEVSYLLQRLESYDGIVILATNLQRNIDAAFVRRLSLAVEFPLPERPERRRIWRGAFPGDAPTRDVDLDFLADSFKVSGGVIRNAALGAAFLAAADRQVITMEHLALALKREFQKAGRLRTPEEFGRYYDLVTGDDDAESAR